MAAGVQLSFTTSISPTKDAINYTGRAVDLPEVLIQQADGLFLPTSVIHDPQTAGLTGILINLRASPLAFPNMIKAAKEVVNSLPSEEQFALWILQGDPADNSTAQAVLAVDVTPDRRRVVSDWKGMHKH